VSREWPQPISITDNSCRTPDPQRLGSAWDKEDQTDSRVLQDIGLSKLGVDAVCGPLVEGAFVALMVALLLNVQFTYSERFARVAEGRLFPAGYRVPAPLREGLRGKRVAIVNDVINAGSAMRGTFADLQNCGAVVVDISALLVLGTAAPAFASSKGIPLRSVATLPNVLWTPSECPLCVSRVLLEDIAAFAVAFPAQGASG
jgi:orotate phosphoribosyltransferase